MNPGKVVDAPPMTESLRYGPAYRAASIPTIQDFSRDGGFVNAVELCSGVGACRKPRGGTMCPSYMVTMEEEHSTRGRANALREAISGRLPADTLVGRELYEVMDLCIGCKACKAECPSNVDMAKLKHEFLARYYAAHGLPLRARMFGRVADLGAIGRAAVRLLEAAGCEVVLAPARCCGRPMISNGMLREAQAIARANTQRLDAFAREGVPLVGLEPSCTVTLTDEYPDLAPGEAADRVARQTFMIEEFLVHLHERGIRLPFGRQERRVLLHGHCHQKAMVGTQPSHAARRWLPGATVQEVDSGCCGMAGSFGYEAEHYDMSLAMGERVLFKAIRELPPDALIVAAGTSCRQQILHGTGRRALHLVEALAGALDG